ncbi:MAG: ornithine carbamoyltransferase [Nocardiaceae bacterium]|nr:ornithine carbamoyltransferase [Microbacteriaceae bacterium]MCL2532683.1 ornithine carbamoyltransferase [Nocardiaceae bacterium]
MTRHFLRDDDLTPAEQAEVIELAVKLKADRFAERTFAGPQTVAIIMDKPTLRTQTSFTVGVAELQGNAFLVDGAKAQIGTRESVEDVARVIGRQVSAIVWRTFAQSDIETMAEYSGVPVVNALTDDFHPCQILADLLTIREHKGELAGLTMSYIGDGANNMAHSYLLGGALAGMHVRIATPAGYQPRADIVADAERIAAQTGGSVTITAEPAQMAAGADIIVTDTWVSMGQEDDKAERRAAFADYTVGAELMGAAKPDAIFLHCLPAYRGYEVTAEVIDGPQSVVWDEAENRLHAQKALLAWLLGKNREGADV